MKCALYIEDGSGQIILTPENEFEKKTMEYFLCLSSIGGKLSALEGHFYECSGGYVKQSLKSAYYTKDSLIIRVDNDMIREKKDEDLPSTSDFRSTLEGSE